MRSRNALALATLVMTACTLSPAPEEPVDSLTTLPFFGDGYPETGDPCRRLGENAETVNYLDHTADLIACPETLQDLDSYIAETGAQEVARLDGFVVLSVPNGS